jgi:hypothetical protein
MVDVHTILNTSIYDPIQGFYTANDIITIEER